jgi:formyl-CoA transferase
VRAHNSRGDTFAMQNVAPRLSATPGSVRWTGPELGEHNDEVLISLGYDGDDLDRLGNAAVIG